LCFLPRLAPLLYFFRYLFGGEHPSYDNNTVQGEFWIRGIDVSPKNYYHKGFPGEGSTLSDLYFLTFLGGNFTNLSVDIQGDNGVVVGVELSRTWADQSNPSISLSVSVDASEAIAQQITFSLRSDEGDIVWFYLFVDIRERAPKLKVTPANIDVKVPRNGVARYENVLLENIGSRESGRVEILLPEQPILRSVAGSVIPGLEVDEKRVVTFSFVAQPDMDLGQVFYGTLLMRANETGVNLRYRATVVSTVPASLTVITENEATYFSPDKPNLANCTVRVRSLTSGASYTLDSGPEGNITFPDLVEDVYEIYAQKLKHQPFRTTIFLEAPGQTVLAFLQAEVVSYTFTVVPVEVVDRYIIEVESTFETFVPAPVVVWDPAYPDWGAISSGLIDEIQLTGTNHGFIAAENVTLRWPKYWRNVEFVIPNAKLVDTNQIELAVGTLPANSSVTIPIEIKHLVAFDVPDDRILRRYGNNAVLLPASYDPLSGIGPNFLIVPGEDPINGQILVQMRDSDFSLIDYWYEYATSTLHTVSYNDTGGVDVVVTTDAAIPSGNDQRRLSHGSEPNGLVHRKLCFDVVEFVQTALITAMCALPGAFIPCLLLLAGQAVAGKLFKCFPPSRLSIPCLTTSFLI